MTIFTYLRGAVLVVLIALQNSCAAISHFRNPTQKYCGRDYGDRIHWIPAPRWFTSQDCIALSGEDALWSDLYLACFSRHHGMVTGQGTLALPKQNDCDWDRFVLPVKTNRNAAIIDQKYRSFPIQQTH